MTKYMYELWHFHIKKDEEWDIYDESIGPKDIGLYSTEENAKAAIDRLKDKPGFRDWENGFRIVRVPVDKDGWVDGFVNPYDDPYWPRPEKE